MKLQFTYSKAEEKAKLLNVYKKYQWFIDTDFPIVSPDFFKETYRQNRSDEKVFAQKISSGLNKVYRKNEYQQKSIRVKNSWQKIERPFFTVLGDFILPVRDRYVCHVSLYGPEGRFQYPDTISLRVSAGRDINRLIEAAILAP